ncbi:MAG: aminotransferase class I/II-fold pyridoxal phosphate-dependent enzyme [Wenzhouxiangellaceae bacterium]|nr:aminotransferase class I/II-fold pyridoxal phosphate-dependent enzyme [Wenzhouxiangellaceae bacterium]
MSLFDKFARLAEARSGLDVAGGIPPVATPIDDVFSASEGEIGGRRVILAGTNNYLGLTMDPDVVEATAEAVRRYGTGTTGSRMANGSYGLHRQLEQALADAWGWPSAIVYSTGYQANLGTISTLAGKDDFLLLDSDSHASIYDGARLGQAQTVIFRHNDPENLDRRLTRLGDDARRAVVVVEGLYSMLGDQPPLAEFIEVKRRHGAWLLLDEAHSFGVFGERGLGLAEHLDLLDGIDFVVGTFSKSLGSIGGFCVSPHRELELVRLAARPFIFTASPSPAVMAGTRVALEKVLSGRALRDSLWRNIHALHEALEDMGYELGSADPGPVAAIVLPDRASALAHWRGLIEAGVYANLMIPPATPKGLNLLRISLSAAHTPEQVDAMIRAFRSLREAA